MGDALAQTLAAPLRIRVDAAPDLPPVLVDRQELEAVLASLAATARDAMPEGGTLTLGAVREDIPSDAGRTARLRPGRYVRLFVADTGTGLGSGGGTPADTEARDLPTKRAGGGTDLGLAMARELAGQSGGAVDLGISAGAGTTVTIWLPRA